MNFLRQIIIFLIISVFLSIALILANAQIQQKTVEYFLGQDTAVRNSGDWVCFNFTINLPETPTLTAAVMEITGIAYNSSGDHAISVAVDQNQPSCGASPAATPSDYAVLGSTKAKKFKILHDAFAGGAGSLADIVAANTDYQYNLYIRGAATGGKYSIDGASLKLTYQYSSSGSVFLKTNQFFVGVEAGQTPSGSVVSKNFTVCIGESNPQTKSVFIEASGIVRGSGASDTIEISVVKQGNPASYTSHTVDLSGLTSTSQFRVLYPVSSLVFLDSEYPGCQNYTFSYRGTGFTTYLVSAKIIVTYRYGVAGLPVSGNLTSSVFDTFLVTGASDGAAYNSLMWTGNLGGAPGGKVRLQLATSDLSSGPWTYYGSTCLGGSYYQLAPNTPVEIVCPIHNNKRYFRYKITLCSNDCSSAGVFNPQVTDVYVNWSP